ncbi:MAG: GHKL domain-containing protein [Lachnospiraceae bacterium]|nr:GHKL domain-containing protein [Lachnospiraceae bacterium]
MYEALITNIINNIFHVVWFYNLVLEPKHNKGKTLFITALTGVLFQFVFVTAAQLGLPRVMFFLGAYLLTAIVFGSVFLFVLSASNPKKAVFLISAYYCLWTFIYGLISLATQSGAGAGSCAVWGLRFGLNLFFLLLYRRFFKKKLLYIYRQMRSGYGMIACISGLTFVMMTFLLLYNEYHKEKNVTHIFIMTLCYLFMLIVHMLLFYFMAQADHAHQLRLMQMHEHLLMAQMETYEKIERSARQTRHDFRHHNMVVMELAERQDYSAILEYLAEYERIEEEKIDRKFSENYAVNSLISAYMRKAQQSGIEMNADIRLGQTRCISDVDLVSLFSNILENAVFGCAQAATSRKIEIVARQKKSMILLKCKNNCTDDIHFCNGIPQAKDHQGIGVESILNIAEKYSGDVHFTAENGIFCCSVLLRNCS